MHWYVIKTKPKKEESVSQRLQRASFEVFLPKLKFISHQKMATVNYLLKPLFPSYLFIRANFKNPSIKRLVHFTRGVSRILGDKEGPQPVSKDIVELLQERTRDGSLIEQELLYKEGAIVRVKKGLLKDLVGIIEKNITDAGRVKILFKWLNGNMRAILRYSELEKAA